MKVVNYFNENGEKSHFWDICQTMKSSTTPILHNGTFQNILIFFFTFLNRRKMPHHIYEKRK